jgi:Protein of unknown function (DUF1018)
MGTIVSAIHAGFAQLGIDEAGRRLLYGRITGKDGLTAMSAVEREAVLTELRRLGLRPAGKRQDGRRKLSGRYARKLQALWIAAYNLGLVKHRDDSALEIFVRRQTGLERERFLHHADDAAKVIEALKAWLHGDGGVDWKEPRLMPAYRRQPGYKIARAQWKMLQPDAADGFWPAVSAVVMAAFPGSTAGATPDSMTAERWITVMNAFGTRIRERR